MGYINYSIYLPDPELLRRVKKAAREQKVSPGAVFRLAAEQYVAQHEKRNTRSARVKGGGKKSSKQPKQSRQQRAA